MAYRPEKVAVIGGGQLGRMLLQEAPDLDLQVSVLDPSAAAPCAPFVQRFTQGSLTDYDTVMAFAAEADVVTIEIENVSLEALYALQQQGKRVYPQPEALEIIKDKRLQKQFYADHGIPTAPFVLTDSLEQVQQNTNFLPAFQKLGTGGYDGRGVQRLESAADLPKAFAEPSLLEKAVDLHKELSVIVARRPSGQMKFFPPVELVFDPEANLVDYLVAPATISDALATQAQQLAGAVAEKLNIVGLLAVELFLDKAGELLVNEVAPRPHNSGHHTIEAAFTSQFGQHWRAILDLPLGHTGQHSLAAMVNLVGAPGHTGPAVYEGLAEVVAQPQCYVHLYGKAETRPFRKMGHVTLLGPDLDSLRKKVNFVKQTLSVKSQ